MTTAPIDLDRAEWNRRLHARWRKGAENYRDASFRRPFAETCRQILEEIEDTAGWLFVAWIQARMNRNDDIDLRHLEKLERDFLVASDFLVAPRADSIDPVESIEWAAACQFTRWQLMRARLMRVLRELEQQRVAQQIADGPPLAQRPERGRRGSNNDPRSSD